MNLPLAKFDPAPAVFLADKLFDFARLNQDINLKGVQISAAAVNFFASSNFEVSSEKAIEISPSVPQQSSFAEQVFDTLVSLKVAVSQYAMHVPSEERERIFSRLDSIINVEDWHEEDQLPLLQSFQNFLKWIIYAERFDWSSIGVSNEGHILVAWSRPRLALTANFSTENKVTWTATVETEIAPAHAVGTCTLQYFARLSVFYLDEGKGGGL